MKSTEFITENGIYDIQDKWHLDDWFVNFIIKIKNKCQPYLQEVGIEDSLKLYRGIQSYEPVLTKQIRLGLDPEDERDPRGMSKEEKEMVNDYFMKEFGEPYRDSMLCTGDLMATKEFGESYVVFPIGDFTFLWSKDVRDLNRSMNKLIVNAERGEDPQYVPDLIPNRATYQDTELLTGIRSDNEIMIRASGYYAISYKYKLNDYRAIKEIFNL